MKKIICLLLYLSLTACATQQQFDCPYKEGAHCLSVGEIDKKINAGEVGDGQTISKTPGKMASRTSFSATYKAEDFKLENPSISSPLRTEETILSLWVAPFYSIDGTYHEARRSHFVAKEASWTGVNAEVLEENL